jgi:hypothetical protein
VRRGDAMIGSRDHAYGRPADLTPAKNAQHRTQCLGCVDQDEGRVEHAVGAVQVELDRPVRAGVQDQECSRRLRRRIIVEPTCDEHDAALEELFLQRIAEGHASQRTTRVACTLTARRRPGEEERGVARLVELDHHRTPVLVALLLLASTAPGSKVRCPCTSGSR